MASWVFERARPDRWVAL